MESSLRLMCILAHPDDETLGTGGILAKYAAEGVETYLVMATRGERGWALKTERPGLEEIGSMREEELRCAAQVLGVSEVYFLGYIDGDVSEADPQEAVNKIAPYIRQVRPQVVVTFDPLGVYGHPDHIAISQFALAAVMAAASPDFRAPGDLPPFTVPKVYFMAERPGVLEAYMETMGGDIRMVVDGQERGPASWPGWGATTSIDFGDHWDTVVEAIRCHKTQGLPADSFAGYPNKYGREVWGQKTYYRVYSLVNGGRQVETDLFEGLRLSKK